MQTVAILLDSWRLLMSRKLFWITMAINLLVVVLYGSVGFTSEGISIGYGLWTFENETYRLGASIAKDLYAGILSTVIVSLWLTWVAVALGLVSTSSIFPDFLADGAIDMVVSKPLSRVKVFLVKFLGSLLFAVLQVSVFCAGSFLCLGLRIERWEWGLFAAIPLVVLVYSYLYAMLAFVGVVTRSAIAAILVTGIFWLVLFAVTGAEQLALRFRIDFEVRETMLSELESKRQTRLDELAAEGKNSDNSNEYERVRGYLESTRSQLGELRESLATATAWHSGFDHAYSFLPKTQATTALLQRVMQYETGQSFTDIMTDIQRQSLERDMAQLGEAGSDEGEEQERRDGPGRRRRFLEERQRQLTVEDRMSEIESTRSAWWVIGTSVLFEALLLALTAWIFARRDF